MLQYYPSFEKTEDEKSRIDREYPDGRKCTQLSDVREGMAKLKKTVSR